MTSSMPTPTVLSTPARTALQSFFTRLPSPSSEPRIVKGVWDERSSPISFAVPMESRRRLKSKGISSHSWHSFPAQGHHAQTILAYESHCAAAKLRLNLPPQLHSRRAALFESGRNYNGGFPPPRVYGRALTSQGLPVEHVGKSALQPGLTF